jgi:hypothetical protein
LLHWLMNALNRHGFQCSYIYNKVESPHISALSATEFILTHKNEVKKADSIGGLLNFLRFLH